MFCSPYCDQIKALVETLGLAVPAHIVEVNQRPDMSDLQDRLKEMTGARTVPRVFVGGKSVGGCDDTMAAHSSGALKKMLTEAGAYGAPAATPAAVIDEALAKAPLVIFSKTTCPYCDQIKALVETLGLAVPAHILEVNQRPDMSDLQDRLKEMTGARSVPRVFVGGKSVGGCDDTVAAHSSGALKAQLTEAGAFGRPMTPAAAATRPTTPAAASASSSESTSVLLEGLPDNTGHTLAYQLKTALSLEATPMLIKLGESSAVCYLGAAADVPKAAKADSVTLFGIKVTIKPYDDGAGPPIAAPPQKKAKPAAAPAPAAAGA